jgi:hypothetical protein
VVGYFTLKPHLHISKQPGFIAGKSISKTELDIYSNTLKNWIWTLKETSYSLLQLLSSLEGFYTLSNQLNLLPRILFGVNEFELWNLKPLISTVMKTLYSNTPPDQLLDQSDVILPQFFMFMETRLSQEWALISNNINGYICITFCVFILGLLTVL